MLRHTHFDMKGGKETFAASRHVQETGRKAVVRCKCGSFCFPRFETGIQPNLKLLLSLPCCKTVLSKEPSVGRVAFRTAALHSRVMSETCRGDTILPVGKPEKMTPPRAMRLFSVLRSNLSG
jgi:hypothetical protein